MGTKSKYLLGVSAYYHDAAACLLKNGEVVAAAQEERFTRKKQDARFPVNAIRYCLSSQGVQAQDLEAVVFYDKPFLTFERLLETHLRFVPRGYRSFFVSMPVWLKEKLFLRRTLQKEFRTHFELRLHRDKLLFGEHHESHAASAFFPSGFEEAAVLCLDGVGEWATTSAWLGRSNKLEKLWEIHFPHSLGLLYSAFTYYTGFKVNSGEYKVMGLAPYGRPTYVDLIYKHLIDLKEDGTFKLNMDYFDYCTGLTMTNDRFSRLFGGPPRKPETALTQKEMDLARSVQEVTEEILLRLAKTVHRNTGAKNLCLAGGVALNCVANGRLLREGPFEKLWIQPAAGDAGGSLGCALAAWHGYYGEARSSPVEMMKGAYLGPSFSDGEIENFLKTCDLPYCRMEDDELFDSIAAQIEKGEVIGWFQGRMEFGPRALGARSIIGDARSPRMQSIMNLKIKYRESFRPFAPSVLRETVARYFEMDTDSPYMLLVAPVAKERRLSVKGEDSRLWGIDLLNVPKSDIPAITHVDYSARIQTVHADTNPRYHRLIKAFEKKTGCSVIVNTSFNVRGEPIVCSPEDAYRCFMRTEMDTLVLGNYVLNKTQQHKSAKNTEWMREFELD